VSAWTREQVRRAINGRWLAPVSPEDAAAPVGGFSTDSREVRPGEAFVALAGERSDGHEFAEDAARRGASLVIASRDVSAYSSVPVAQAACTRGALTDLARAHRRRLSGRVIAVTGSNGKTTTVRLIDAALGAALHGTASRKSFNNDIGVPLTLLRAGATDDYLVSEIGTNAPGEILPLAALARPDAAVVTSIGRAHLERLGDLRGVVREKMSLASGLGAGSLLVTPEAPEGLARYAPPHVERITFGRSREADIRLVGFEHAALDGAGPPDGMRIEVAGVGSFEIPLIGAHNAMNALAAIATARWAGVPDAAIREGLRRARAPEMRLSRRRVGPVDLFDDSYNANPDSALAAVRTFMDLTPDAPRRVLAMGDMLELGAEAEAAHEAFGDEIAGLGDLDLVIAVGPLARRTARRIEEAAGATAVMLGAMSDEEAARLAGLIEPGDAALLKGSRAVGLERLAAALEARFAAAAQPGSGTAGGVDAG